MYKEVTAKSHSKYSKVWFPAAPGNHSFVEYPKYYLVMPSQPRDAAQTQKPLRVFSVEQNMAAVRQALHGDRNECDRDQSRQQSVLAQVNKKIRRCFPHHAGRQSIHTTIRHITGGKMETCLLFLWALQQYEGWISLGCMQKSVCSGFVQGIFGLLGEIFWKRSFKCGCRALPFFP